MYEVQKANESLCHFRSMIVIYQFQGWVFQLTLWSWIYSPVKKFTLFVEHRRFMTINTKTH